MASTQDMSSEMPITAKSENRNSPVASGLRPIAAKAMMPMTVAPSSGICVFDAASSAASRERRPRFMALCMPSATSIALSTSMPIAMINAPSEIRSISMENSFMNRSVPTTVNRSVVPTSTAAANP